ncbi:hypothetical protein BKA66DRAFT_546854 [Pyrenochaeta sp. MPI-SDFR-AT-0127]|nr:hypothetical protein BKA66DRAFT_546854 [Pyrenochaeta sp. MPI-SDFR-AT-0127]
MKFFGLIAALGLIVPSLAIPCVTQMEYYNVNRRDSREMIQMCWDTATTACKGTARDLVAKPGANVINRCTNTGGKINWHLATGWTLFGQDLESQDVNLQVGTTSCSVTRYQDIFVKIFGLPMAIFRTDDAPTAINRACPF